MTKYLLDTCALIWWTLDPGKLSPKALRACEKMEKSEGLISSISLWEIGIKIKNRKLDIGMSIESYAKKLHSLGFLKILPVDERCWLKNLSLDWKHRDPADRTIVATATLEGSYLITSDEKIRKFYNKTVW